MSKYILWLLGNILCIYRIICLFEFLIRKPYYKKVIPLKANNHPQSHRINEIIFSGVFTSSSFYSSFTYYHKYLRHIY